MSLLRDPVPALSRYAKLIRAAQKKPKPKTGKRPPHGPSTLELELRGQILCAGLAKGIEVEYRALPDRKFRWDLAWPEEPHRLLVEIQGGIKLGARGGHSSEAGITRDCEKMNLATLAGWRTLAVTGDQIKSGQALAWIQQALSDCK